MTLPNRGEAASRAASARPRPCAAPVTATAGLLREAPGDRRALRVRPFSYVRPLPGGKLVPGRRGPAASRGAIAPRGTAAAGASPMACGIAPPRANPAVSVAHREALLG